MGKQNLRKRSKRVFSLDPNKLAYTMFARNYAKYLMVSLPKISSNPSQHQQQDFQKLVKFEVDMAMAQSATEFAWGNALKKKLLIQRQEACNNGFDFPLQTVNFSQDQKLEREEEEEEKEEEEEEEKKMENGLMKLRKILPGGNGDSNGDLEEDDLLKQTESYIKCLELQVNVLRCLVDTNSI